MAQSLEAVATAIVRELEDAASHGAPVGIEDYDDDVCSPVYGIVNRERKRTDPDP